MDRRGGARQVQPFTDADLDALFWEQVDKTGDCWIWTGCQNDHGYGRVTRRKRPRQAHRVAYEISVGPIPDGLEILHSCDVRLCVRPDHLRPGTRSENEMDKVARGRHPRLGRRRFLDDDIRAVVGLVSLGWTQKQAASLFGMNPSHVSRLVRGESGRVGGVRT